MARYPQREHLSRCPPKAAVRQRSIAANTFRCWPVIQRRLASMNFCPATRMRSATSSGGRFIYSSPGGSSFLPVARQRQCVQRTGGSAKVAAGKVDVEGGFFQIAVTKQHLDGAQVRTRFVEMRRKTMAKRVHMHGLVEARTLSR